MESSELFGIILIVGLLAFHKSLRVNSYLTTSAIPTPEQSPWQFLWDHGDENSFIALTGFNRVTFQELHMILFGRGTDEPPQKRMGRPERDIMEALRPR